MLQYMLDTNTCIHVIKNYPERLRQRFNRHGEQLCISSITLAELRFGAEKSARRVENLQEIEIFAARVEVLSFGSAAAAHYGEIRAELERAGKPVGVHDMLIGAHARSEGLIIVTRNLKEFSRISGLRAEDWV
jgi:tRNA(fMet)-specific endonuclease VapC